MSRKSRSRKKHIPQRTCVACRVVRAKWDFIRVVNTSEGGIEIDMTGKLNGRGAYLCKKQACWDLALRTGSLSRALRLSLTDNDYAVLHAYADNLPDNDIEGSIIDE